MIYFSTKEIHKLYVIFRFLDVRSANWRTEGAHQLLNLFARGPILLNDTESFKADKRILTEMHTLYYNIVLQYSLKVWGINKTV